MKSRALLLFATLFLSQTLFAADTLRVLSWNIFMVPPAIFKSDQMNRAQMIGEVLDKCGADVLVLQETFMKKTREAIQAKIGGKYVYDSGKPKGSGFFKTNSGVWILSKLPINDLQFVRYKNCHGSDCFSGKGAYVFSVTKGNHKVFMAGTHVQSADAAPTRQKQFAQLVAETAHIPADVPFLITGDLNTDLHNAAEYKAMLQTLQAEDGPMGGEKYSYAADNDLAKRFFGESNSTLDYMLVRDKAQKIAAVKRTIFKFTSVTFGTHTFKDLSDHYALSSEVIFK